MTAQNAPTQRLLTPGPTAVPPQVLQAMAQPIIHHRTKEFQGIFKEVCEGLQDSAFRGALRDNHGIHIAGGQNGRGAKWKGKIFRLSHMGFVDQEDTRAALSAIEVELNAQGYNVESGAAVKAFDAVWG